MAEKKVGPRGKVVSVYMSFESINLIDKVAAAFEISRSDVVDSLVESKRKELIDALAHKTNSLSGGT